MSKFPYTNALLIGWVTVTWIISFLDNFLPQCVEEIGKRASDPSGAHSGSAQWRISWMSSLFTLISGSWWLWKFSRKNAFLFGAASGSNVLCGPSWSTFPYHRKKRRSSHGFCPRTLANAFWSRWMTFSFVRFGRDRGGGAHFSSTVPFQSKLRLLTVHSCRLPTVCMMSPH